MQDTSITIDGLGSPGPSGDSSDPTRLYLTPGSDHTSNSSPSSSFVAGVSPALYDRQEQPPMTMMYNHGNVAQLPNGPETHATEDTPIHAEAHDPSHVITKSQARILTQQFAHFLRHSYDIGSAGPSKDVVVCVSTGQSALPCLFWSVIAADGIYSAASSAATPADIARQIRDGPGRLLVCSEDLRTLGVAAARAAGLPQRNLLLLKSYPRVELYSAADTALRCDFGQKLEWPRLTDPSELEARTACILYSSGTTGLPKGVRISHTNMVAEGALPSLMARPVFDRWAAEGRPLERRTLGHLPTAHIAGVQGYFVNAFYEGCCVYWTPKFSLADFAKYCQQLRITHILSVPPIFMAIAKHPAIKDALKHIRIAVSGAAPLGGETQEAANRQLPDGTYISQVWGLSETTGSVTYTPPDVKLANGSLGFLLPNMTMRLVDDHGQDVEPGHAGEAWIKGPVVTKGYHNRPEANKSSFTEDGWFKTGDVLRVENEQLFIVDRKKELIKYKGLQVAPAELEGILVAHPAVADAAVVGIPRDGNELPRAYVVLVPGASGQVTEENLKDYVKRRVSDYKQLRGGIVFVDTVPRSASGKLLRRQLRDVQSKEGERSKL
ncbi:hypothetical protein E4U55_001805 [Claviceps digitariae]|nr:hypothetical protein E4U55_001805 [Claviceps digitariae]